MKENKYSPHWAGFLLGLIVVLANLIVIWGITTVIVKGWVGK